MVRHASTVPPDRSAASATDVPAERAKTLRRAHSQLPGYARATKAASWLTECHVRLNGSERDLAAALGVGKSRAHQLVSMREPQTMTVADVIYLGWGDDGPGKAIARGVARDVAIAVGAVPELRPLPEAAERVQQLELFSDE